MFRIAGLDPAPFRLLYGLTDEQLAEHGATRRVVNAKPGFPDRIELRDLEPGETALLVNFVHQPANTQYRASHAIFVREGAKTAFAATDVVPDMMRIRPLSLRAFDATHMMTDADLVEGQMAETVIARMFAHRDVAYIHVHYAKRGCFAARIDRA